MASTYSFNPLTGPTSINATTAGDQFNSDLVSLGNGDSVAIYATIVGGPLFAREIGPDGAPIGSEVTVAPTVQVFGHQYANAAVLTNGNIVVTWADTAATQLVHYRIYDQNLNSVTPIEDIAATVPTLHPDVAALVGGGFVITFEAILPGGEHNIYAYQYTAAGVQNGALIPVNASAATLDEYPSVDSLVDGGFAIAHDRNTAGNTAMWASVWNANGSNRSPDAQFDGTGTGNNFASVAALPAGGFAVNYGDNQYAANLDISSAYFSAAGALSLISRDTNNGNNNSQPKGAVSADGYQLVASTNIVGTIDTYGTLLSPSGAILLQAGALDAGPGEQAQGAPVWIDPSHVVFTEFTNGTGGDGAGFGIASLSYEVLRTTTGDSATPLDFSSNGIDNLVNLGSGNDTVFGGGGVNFIVGNGGNDELIGGGGPSGAGNTIYAFGGNDYLQGGSGSPSDVLVATGPGNDTFYGGTGNNYIVGPTGRNTIVGGGGALETLYGNGSGGDYIVGGSSPTASNVLAEDGTGSAQLWGGPGNNYEVGGPGDDLVVGGNNSDYLFGANGHDTIYGGNGTDYIYPGSGNDFIWTDNIGSQSTDYVYEGIGTGVDTIADFTPGDGAGHDVLVFTAANSEMASFLDVQQRAFQAGAYTVLPLSNTDQIYLYNVQPSQLTANDFIFTRGTSELFKRSSRRRG